MIATTDSSLLYAAGFSAAAVEELSLRKGEPAWLRERRREAWAVYEQTPMPSRTEESWRRTDLSLLRLDGMHAFAAGPDRAGSVEELPAQIREALPPISTVGGLAVQCHSEGVFSSLSAEAEVAGVRFGSLDEAVALWPELVEPHLLQIANPARGKFAALHGALWSGGSFLYVPPDVHVTLPFHSLCWSDIDALGLFPHTLIVCDRHSSVTFLDEYQSANPEQSLVSGAVEAHIGEGAQLNYVQLQGWAASAYNLSCQLARVERDGVFNGVGVFLGGRLSRNEIEVELRGTGASSRLQSVVFGAGHQHFDQQTLQDHIGRNTTSDLLMKAALKDESRSVFMGLIRILGDARGSNAFQTARNLLLSEKAKADAIPSLEILANDVKCKHAAAVGQVDESQLFYLMSRGLNREEAQRMIVLGFFEPVIAGVPLESVRERLWARIEGKLDGPHPNPLPQGERGQVSPPSPPVGEGTRVRE